jgi:hypothetical protein
MDQKIDRELVRRQIEAALAEAGWGSAESRSEVGFHMTDWIDGLEDLYRHYQDPAGRDAESTMELLIQFLVHAPNHLAAASKMLTDIPVTDVFGVGALEETDE